MSAVTRRQALASVAALGASAFIPSALALDPAKTLEDVSAEVQAGKFELAAQRLQLHLTEWPLDRDARANLAMTQFGAEQFAMAEQNLGRIVKLQRSYSRDRTPVDPDYLEAWYWIARCRAGQPTDVPPATLTPSFLAVPEHASKIEALAADLTDAHIAYLERLSTTMNKSATAVKDGFEITVTSNFELPDRSVVYKAYVCIANFLLGEQALSMGQREAAKRYLGAAIATQSEVLIEYYIAKVELARLG
jgi:tetratricopeptide (TPR) repeat protein